MKYTYHWLFFVGFLPPLAFAGGPYTTKTDAQDGIATVLYSYENTEKPTTPVSCRFEPLQLDNPPPHILHTKTKDGYVTTQSPWDTTAGKQQQVYVRKCYEESGREVDTNWHKYQNGAFITRFLFNGTQYAVATDSFVRPGTRFHPSPDELAEQYLLPVRD